MGELRLNKIEKMNNTMKFDFSYSEDLKDYFTGKPFLIHYPENIEEVPDGICAVPFVCSILPMVWLTDSDFYCRELDEDFYHSIPEFEEGYKKMYPRCDFRGRLHIEHLLPMEPGDPEKCAMFFSGGADSMDTFLSHIKEKPDLISIWGSDIKYENEEGWEKTHQCIIEQCKSFALKDVVIRSSFRKFDWEPHLSRDFKELLGDNWWHGVKHGIGLLGHVAPYAYLHRLSRMYIASSYSVNDRNYTCASDPKIDNHVRYCGCQVIHDGYEHTRQDKIRHIVKFVEEKRIPLPLHVCWESQSGENCSHCEKCYRTMFELMLEGANPVEYGFAFREGIGREMKQTLQERLVSGRLNPHSWLETQEDLRKTKAALAGNPYKEEIEWLLHMNLNKLYRYESSREYKLKQQLEQNLVYRKIRKLKWKMEDRRK